MCFVSGSNDAAYYRQQEDARQAAITSGTEAINKTFGDTFTPAYFDRQRTNYLNYAMPQLDAQKAKADQSLVFSLARSGNLESSTRAQQAANLQGEYDQNARGVADNALSYENSARNAVSGAQNDLIATLNATGDATAAANSATERAKALSQPAVYDPIGNLFADVTGNIASNAAAQNAAYYASLYGANAGGSAPGSVSGWYGAPRGSVVVR